MNELQSLAAIQADAIIKMLDECNQRHYREYANNLRGQNNGK